MRHIKPNEKEGTVRLSFKMLVTFPSNVVTAGLLLTVGRVTYVLRAYSRQEWDYIFNDYLYGINDGEEYSIRQVIHDKVNDEIIKKFSSEVFKCISYNEILDLDKLLDEFLEYVDNSTILGKEYMKQSESQYSLEYGGASDTISESLWSQLDYSHDTGEFKIYADKNGVICPIWENSGLKLYSTIAECIGCPHYCGSGRDGIGDYALCNRV